MAELYLSDGENYSKVTAHDVDVVQLSGDTMEGRLTAPEIAASSYFVTPTMVGEGNNSTYYHRIDYGYAGHNSVDSYEYGGTWNFYQNRSGTKDKSVLVGSIQPDGFHGNLKGKSDSAKSVDEEYSICVQSEQQTDSRCKLWIQI